MANLRRKAQIWMILSGLVLGGCATSEGDVAIDETKGPGAAFHVLKAGTPTEYQRPLPTKMPVLVNWKFSDGSTRVIEAFRGWDINHDGRFDMLEVLDGSGKTESWTYDFDGDAVIDVVEHAKTDYMPPSLRPKTDEGKPSH